MFNGLAFSAFWSWGVCAFLLLLSLLYVAGLWQVRRRLLHHSDEKPVGVLRIAAFFVAIALCVLLLLTPINTIARNQLFFMHMVQVVVLTTICAPLLMAGCPASVLRPLVEIPVVREIVFFITRPLVASIIFNLTFLLWHIPKFYGVAMSTAGLYNLMMLSIFCTALLNWFPLIGSLRPSHEMSYPVKMMYAFFDGQPVDIFAFVLVFSGVTLYTHYHLPAWIGISPFADQTVAGALLLIPGLVDLGVMTPYFFRWLGQIEQKTRQADLRRLAEAAEDEDEELEDAQVQHLKA